MPAAKSHIPVGCHAITPYLVVKGAAEAIAFYKAAFGAKERFRLTMGDKLPPFTDPFGHRWPIRQRIEDVSPQEMQRGLDAMMAPGGAYATETVKAAGKKPKRKG